MKTNYEKQTEKEAKVILGEIDGLAIWRSQTLRERHLSNFKELC